MIIADARFSRRLPVRHIAWRARTDGLLEKAQLIYKCPQSAH